MVSVWRYRAWAKIGAHRTVGRYRRGALCTVWRSYSCPLCTVGRSKACVFERCSLAVCAALESLDCPHVIAWVTVQGVPRHRVPTRLVGAMALHGLMNEPSVQQFALCLAQHVRRLPASCLHVGARQKQSPVVVPDILPCNLQKQGAGVHAQAGIGGGIEDGPGQRHKTASIPPAIALLAPVTTVRHQVRQPSDSEQRHDVRSRRGHTASRARCGSGSPSVAVPAHG